LQEECNVKLPYLRVLLLVHCYKTAAAGERLPQPFDTKTFDRCETFLQQSLLQV
jgi:hypothetical protein